MNNKKCSTCGEVRDLAYFRKSTSNPDGFANTCKPCKKNQAVCLRNKRLEQIKALGNDIYLFTPQKKCGLCSEIKATKDFYISASFADLFSSRCKKCHTDEAVKYYSNNKSVILEKNRSKYEENKPAILEKNRQWRANNPEKMQALNKKYRADNLQKIKEANRLYRINNAEKLKEQRKASFEIRQKRWMVWSEKNKDKIAEYRRVNKERIRANGREYYKNNHEKCLMQSKKYRAKNKEKTKIRIAIWEANNPEKVRARTHRRRAKAAHVANNFTASQWKKCLGYFHHCCAYCGRTAVVLHQEHVIPLFTGGGYLPENIVPACIHCNSSKTNMPMISWYSRQPYFNQSRLNKILSYMQEVKA